MKRFIRCSGILVGGFFALVVLAGLSLYVIGTRELARTFQNIPIEHVSIPSRQDAIVRGRHIAIIWSCTKCHGDDLSGRVLTRDPLIGQVPLLASISASNLTAGRGGVGSSYTNVDWVRAIRHGIMPDGERAEVYMYGYFSTMSDQDLGDLIAYLKQLPPIDSELPRTSYGPIFPIFPAMGLFKPEAESIVQGAPRPPDPSPGANREYGKYLSVLCAACHPILNNELRGWNRDDFLHTFQTGRLPNGSSFGTTMSSETFTELNDVELSALWLYFEGTTSSK